MAQDTKNFKVSEFTCKCGCGFNNVDQRLMDMAQKIRDDLGVAIKINSGCRCAKHNAKVGGVKNSTHTRGFAADLSCSLGAKAILKSVQKLYAEGKLNDLSFCKEYKTFIHIDCGQKRKSVFDLLK